VAEALVVEVGAEPVWVEEADRPLYHAALAHGANHLVTLIAQSLEALRAAGVERPHRLLGPLVGAALDNSLRAGDAALTGPVARGDVGTVAEHLRQLERLSPDIRPTYVALARATAERALSMNQPLVLDARPLFNSQLNYSDFFLPGLMFAILQQIILIGLGSTVAEEREQGSGPIHGDGRGTRGGMRRGRVLRHGGFSRPS
jgi:hypothetical protein